MLDQQKKEKIIKMDGSTILTWLSLWYESNCDGEWEHDYGIRIDTLDNPGWSLTIDLENIKSVINDIEWKYFEKNDHDWFGYKIEDGKFEASGDPSKLELLLYKFKEIVESNQKAHRSLIEE